MQQQYRQTGRAACGQQERRRCKFSVWKQSDLWGTELQLNSFQTAKRTLFPLVGVLLRRALLFIGDS